MVSDWLDEDLSRGVASAGAMVLRTTQCSVDDLSTGLLGLFIVFLDTELCEFLSEFLNHHQELLVSS